jgi:hypothetical protein
LTAPTYGASYGEGKVQGVVKAAQTGILWSQVQVLVGPPIVKKPLISVSGFFYVLFDKIKEIKRLNTYDYSTLSLGGRLDDAGGGKQVWPGWQAAQTH